MIQSSTRGTHEFFSQHFGDTRYLILGSCRLWSATRSHRQREDIRMMREIMEVPLPLAASRRLTSFLIFQISKFFSASLACCWLLMVFFAAACLQQQEVYFDGEPCQRFALQLQEAHFNREPRKKFEVYRVKLQFCLDVGLKFDQRRPAGDAPRLSTTIHVMTHRPR